MTNNNDLDKKIIIFTEKIRKRNPELQLLDPSNVYWDDPEPFNNTSEQKDFPLEAFPEILKKSIEIVAHNNQIPVPIVVASAMSILSVAAQGSYNVQRPDMNPSPISINNIVIAESGDRKTTSDFVFTEPIYRYIGDNKEILDKKIKQAVEAHHIWENVKKELAKSISKAILKNDGNDKTLINNLKEKFNKHISEEPMVPNMPCIFVEDFSQEALVLVLENNPTVSMNSSEGSCVFGGNGFTSEKIMVTIGTINKAWSGEGQETLRKVSKSSKLDGSQRLTVCIMIQKDIFLQTINKYPAMFIDSGFLARFNICEVKSLQGTRLKKNLVLMPEEDVKAFNDLIYSLIKITFEYRSNKENKPIVLTFDEEAKEFWLERCDNIETRLITDFNGIKSSASKAAEQIARIAALFHIITNFDETLDSVPTEISLDCVIDASEVEEWYLQEVARINFNRKADSEKSEAEKKLGAMARACVKKGKKYLNISEVGKITDIKKEGYNPLLEKLGNMGWIRVVSDGGKGKKVFIHPNAIEEARSNESKVVQLTKRSASKKKIEKDDFTNSAILAAEVVTNKLDVSKTAVEDGVITDSLLSSETKDVDFGEVEALITSVSCNS